MVIGQDGKPSALTIDELKAGCEQPGLRAGDRELKGNPGRGLPVPMVVAVVPVKTVHAPNSTRWTRMRKQHVLNGGKISP